MKKKKKKSWKCKTHARRRGVKGGRERNAHVDTTPLELCVGHTESDEEEEAEEEGVGKDSRGMGAREAWLKE